MESISQRALRIVETTKILEERGIKDFLILDPDLAKKVLSDRRLEILRTIRDLDLSVQELAKKLKRKGEAVSRDLQFLYLKGLIKFERKGKGKFLD